MNEYEWKLTIRKGYNPSQPRVPAGSSEGGQWTSGGDYFSLIDQDMYPPEQRAIANILGTIPPQHLEGLQMVTAKAPRGYYYDDAGKLIDRYDGGSCLGVYVIRDKTIHLQMNLLRDEGTAAYTLAHEVGHHVTRESRAWKLDLNNFVGPLKSSLSKEEMAGLGLRNYSFESGAEFLADSYTVWLFGSKSQWDELNNIVTSGMGEQYNMEKLFGKKA